VEALYLKITCTADNGAALYIDDGSTVNFTQGSYVHFSNNLAIEHGGAIYIDLDTHCPGYSFVSQPNNAEVLFIQNSAIKSGNSIYFSIPQLCQLNTNVDDPDSILYLPCQFNYSQSTDKKLHNCTTLNGTPFPIVTSPNELRLYFPNNDGVNISSNSEYNEYIIYDNILGHRVIFTGSVLDYFKKPAESTEFKIKCTDCSNAI